MKQKIFAKEIILSSFLVFSLFFPFLNSYELIFFGTQKTYFFVCLILWVLLFLTFLLFPIFYDKSLNLLFSGFSNYLILFYQKVSDIIKKSPKIVGFFYGFCFLSFFFQQEITDSIVISWITSFLIIARNLSVIPSLGLLALSRWSITNIEETIAEKKISQQDYYYLMKDFDKFDAVLFSSLPFVRLKKNAYNLETRRNMFKMVTQVLEGPSSKAIKETLTTTVGTTVAGSVAISTIASGINADRTVHKNLTFATETAEFISRSTESREILQASLALRRAAEKASTDWVSNSGSVTSFRGIRYLLGESSLVGKVDNSAKLANHASDLKYLHQLPVSSPEENLEKAAKLAELKKTAGFDIPSCLENTQNFFNFF